MRTFSQIEELRSKHGLTRKAVYKRADVSKDTWRRTAAGKTQPNSATLRRLSEALDQLIAEGRAQ